ncbi:hypothetical protein [Reyranella sp.]|uniref:hypothetical protein n=1 Tax=Reyranella sp. TaxID=1929291 RepID=UPI003BA9C1B0
MKRPLFLTTLALAAVALATQAQARPPHDPAQSDALGPKSMPTVTVAGAVARVQIEKSGYTSVRGLQRGPGDVWYAVARDSRNAPVALTVDANGKVTPTR